MPIHFQEIQEEEDHHHLQDYNNHVDDGRGNPQRPFRRKTTAETSTRKLLSIFFKCVVMGFVLSLFLLFIGFAAIVLLQFLLTTTACRRRRRNRPVQEYPQFTTDLNLDSCSREDLQELLPHLTYFASAQTSRDCAICLESFNDGDSCRKLPDCRHLFHVNCVDNWLTKVLNCPICRTRIRLDAGASGSLDRDDEWKLRWPVEFEDDNVSI